MMDVFEAIKGRRSIRKWLDKDVPDDVIAKLVDSGRWAPFSNFMYPPGIEHNHQPWEFVVVRDKATKQKFAEPRDASNKFIANAPVVLVVCVDKKYSITRWVEDGFMAVENILLAAHALGLGTVLMPTYSSKDAAIEKGVREQLNLPENIQPVALIGLGYPSEAPAQKPMRSTQEMTHNEKW